MVDYPPFPDYTAMAETPRTVKCKITLGLTELGPEIVTGTKKRGKKNKKITKTLSVRGWAAYREVASVTRSTLTVSMQYNNG